MVSVVDETGTRKQIWRSVPSGVDPEQELTRMLRELDEGADPLHRRRRGTGWRPGPDDECWSEFERLAEYVGTTAELIEEER